METPVFPLIFSKSFTIKTPLISVNDAYMDRPKKSKSGRWTAYRTAAPALREYQSRVSALVREAIGDGNLTLIQGLSRSKEYGISLDIIVGLPEDICRRSDASNFIKPYEDVISSVIGIDDKYNYHVSIDKYIADSWEIHTVISVINLERWNKEYEEATFSNLSEGDD